MTHEEKSDLIRELRDEVERLRQEMDPLADERDEWKSAYSERFENWRSLLLRAADAIEEVAGYTSGDPDIYRYLRLKEQQLITELRKAAQ